MNVLNLYAQDEDEIKKEETKSRRKALIGGKENELINYEEFADKQVVEDLIKDLVKVINTQNNLIDKLKKWEHQIMDNFISLRTQIKLIQEDVVLIEEGFIKENGKLLKQIRVNKANHFLLEDNFNNLVLKVDLIDKHCRN